MSKVKKTKRFTFQIIPSILDVPNLPVGAAQVESQVFLPEQKASEAAHL